MTLGYIIITGPKHLGINFYYITLNGTQIGSVYFSLKEVEAAIESIKRGDPYPWK